MSRRLTRGQAIKKYCKESCCAGDLKSWRECSVTYCFLWRFRLGTEISLKKCLSEKRGSIVSVSKQKTLLEKGIDYENYLKLCEEEVNENPN